MSTMNAPNAYLPQRLRPFSGSALKLIAHATMLIDHVGAGIVRNMLAARVYPFQLSHETFDLVYAIMRGIGRTAFPIYCFLLVEALFYTKNRLRYLLSLIVFALISEAPFDLALFARNNVANTLHPIAALVTNRERVVAYQNVFFTLAIGFLLIWCVQTVVDAAKTFTQDAPRYALPAYMIMTLVSATVYFAAYRLADAIHTDYAHRGVTLIFVFYLLRKVRPLALLAGFFYIGNLAYATDGFNLAVWSIEFWSFPAFLLMLLYNDERGFIRGKMKYFFYVFYPAHLILIYVARALLL